MNCKTCTKCGEVKALDAFYAEKRARDGKTSQCNVCKNASVAAWRKANSGRLEAKRAAWRKANPEKVKVQITTAQQRAVALLKPHYLAHAMRIAAADVTPEMLALKREQLGLHRLSKQIKTHLKEITK